MPPAPTGPAIVSQSTERSPAESTPRDLVPSRLQRDVLLTLLYSDLFDYPLDRDQLARLLVGPCEDGRELQRALDGLDGVVLESEEGFLHLEGRSELVGLRRDRALRAEHRWHGAARFARLLRHVPFLRMVAVSGSQAVDNPRADSDVDFFLITAPRRLWLVQACTMTLRRLARLLGVHACPNYFLSSDALEVQPPNLYTAREIAQTVPLWGQEAYAEFRRANRWVAGFLPNLGDEARVSDHAIGDGGRVPLRRAAERILGGRLGDRADRLVHRLLLAYYRRRRSDEGWTRADLEQFYEPDRQAVVGHGYLDAIESRFRRRAEELFGESAPIADELDRLFPSREKVANERSPYPRLFDERYGGSGD